MTQGKKNNARRIIFLSGLWLGVGALAAILGRFSGLGFWPALAVVVVALIANGIVATLEDDLPGGFNNPDGEATPRYAVIVSRVARAVLLAGGLLCVFLLVALVLPQL